jgi:drug/metabolite transporter (DMT)-like permease
MKYIEKHPFLMIIVGVMGISLSSILVRYSTAPSALTAAWRLLWTVILMTPVVLGKKEVRRELSSMERKTVLLSILSGVFLAAHFAVWFESLRHTSVASSTTIVCTEVIWVSLGYCLLLKGKLSRKAVLAIAITLAGSVLIALSDASAGESHFFGDMLALIAAVAVAAYTLIGRMVRTSVSTTAYTYIVYSACAVVLVAVCIFQGYGFFAYGISGVLVGLLLALFSTILGHSIFSW